MGKKIFKTAGLLLYFIAAQSIGTIGIFIYKIMTDAVWADKLLETLNAGNMFNTEYISAISEIIIPALILADIIILIPLVVSGIKNYKDEHFIDRLQIKDTIKYLWWGIMLNLFVSTIIELLPSSLVTGKYNSLIDIAVSGNFFVVLFTTGILTPVIEELLFRYGIIRIIRGKTTDKNHISDNKAILISSILFGIAHFNIIQSTYAFVLGLIMGKIYIKTGNILTSICIHIGINASSVIFETMSKNIQGYVFITVTIAMGIYMITKGIKKLKDWIERKQREDAIFNKMG